jgi:hypothetical protein
MSCPVTILNYRALPVSDVSGIQHRPLCSLHSSNIGLYKNVTRRDKEREYKVVGREERDTSYITAGNRNISSFESSKTLPVSTCAEVGV